MSWPRYRRELRDRFLATRLGLMGRQHQYGEIVALRRFISHFGIDCILDVGANTGQYATLLRKDVGFTGTIISFEPNPEIFAGLATRAARDPHWQVQNIALTDYDGTASFHIMAADQFSSLNAPSDGLEPIFAERNRVEKNVTVACRRLDGLMGSRHRAPCCSSWIRRAMMRRYVPGPGRRSRASWACRQSLPCGRSMQAAWAIAR
jgi:FkbM family methyltransferase